MVTYYTYPLKFRKVNSRIYESIHYVSGWSYFFTFDKGTLGVMDEKESFTLDSVLVFRLPSSCASGDPTSLSIPAFHKKKRELNNEFVRRMYNSYSSLIFKRWMHGHSLLIFMRWMHTYTSLIFTCNKWKGFNHFLVYSILCRIPPILSHVFNLCLPSSVIIYILQPRAAVKYHCLLTNQPTTGIDC
jgi:hypothetical protein